MMNPSNNQSPKLERDLDFIIRKNMKGESFFSPLNFSPSYHQDNLSRLKLRGHRENNYNPFFPESSINQQQYHNIQFPLNEGNKSNEINNYNNNQNLSNNYNTINRTPGLNKYYNERTNSSSYSPLIKNANNILDIHNKPRTNELDYKDQIRYQNNIRNEYIDEQNPNMNLPGDLNYLENKYLQSLEERNRLENPNNSLSSMKHEMENNVKKIPAIVPDQGLNEFSKSIQNVDNFSIKKDLISPPVQEVINPQLNSSYQNLPNNNYHQYLNSNRTYNSQQRKNQAKNESFSNSVDHNNRNMIHLLRKY